MKSLLIAFLLVAQAVSLKAQDSSSQQSKPFILGRIDDIYSNILGEKRTLNIYLPEGYKDNDTSRYPVIYLLDGSADEDFIHIAGLVQFLNFPWVNLLPKSIVVGIANVDRRRDFTFPTSVAADKKESPTSGGSAKFIDFIEQELQPFVEKTFKTNSSKTLIGESLGGLLATEILFKKPQLFTTYIIVSPSLWWNNESLLQMKPALQNKDSIKVFIAVGNEGKRMQNDAHQLEKIIQADGKKTVVYFQYFPSENHATILHRAVYSAFESFHNKAAKSE